MSDGVQFIWRPPFGSNTMEENLIQKLFKIYPKII